MAFWIALDVLEMYVNLLNVRLLRSRVLLLAGIGAAFALAACQQAPPQEVQKPRRRSFEESGSWKPSRSTAPADSSGNNVDAQARQVQQTWEQAKQANNDAERQRLANEALNQTQSMAEPKPSGQ